MTGDKNCFTWKETKITVSGTKRRHPIGSSSQFPEESLTHRGVLCPPFFSALQFEGISMGNQRRCNSRAGRVNDEDQSMCGFHFLHEVKKKNFWARHPCGRQQRSTTASTGNMGEWDHAETSETTSTLSFQKRHRFWHDNTEVVPPPQKKKRLINPSGPSSSSETLKIRLPIPSPSSPTHTPQREAQRTRWEQERKHFEDTENGFQKENKTFTIKLDLRKRQRSMSPVSTPWEQAQRTRQEREQISSQRNENHSAAENHAFTIKLNFRKRKRSTSPSVSSKLLVSRL